MSSTQPKMKRLKLHSLGVNYSGSVSLYGRSSPIKLDSLTMHLSLVLNGQRNYKRFTIRLFPSSKRRVDVYSSHASGQQLQRCNLIGTAKLSMSKINTLMQQF